MKFADNVITAKLGKTYLFSVGQAGFIIKSASGELLAVDLYLSNCVERVEGHAGFKRLLPQILFADEMVLDYIIATHPHLDHFDMDSIPQLLANGHTKLYASDNCKQFEEKLELRDRDITYVSQGDFVEAGDFKLEFILCDHGEAAPDAVGVVISVDGKGICMTGDTRLRKDWVQYYEEKGPFDILIGPINGAYGNMNEQDFSVLSSYIRPALTIPCHYGMFASHGGNPGLFIKYMDEKKLKYRLLTMGEGIVI